MHVAREYTSQSYILTSMREEQSSLRDGLSNCFLPGTRIRVDLRFIENGESWNLIRAYTIRLVIHNHPTSSFEKNEVDYAAHHGRQSAAGFARGNEHG